MQMFDKRFASKHKRNDEKKQENPIRTHFAIVCVGNVCAVAKEVEN